MSAPDGDLLESDRIFLTEMEKSNAAFLLALKGRQGERVRFRPRMLNGSSWVARPDSPALAEANRRAMEHRAERARIDDLRVSRDPCVLCGTRGDIGCQHRRVA